MFDDGRRTHNNIQYCYASAYISIFPWISYALTSLVLHLLLAILFAVYLRATQLALISSPLATLVLPRFLAILHIKCLRSASLSLFSSAKILNLPSTLVLGVFLSIS